MPLVFATLSLGVSLWIWKRVAYPFIGERERFFWVLRTTLWALFLYISLGMALLTLFPDS